VKFDEKLVKERNLVQKKSNAYWRKVETEDVKEWYTHELDHLKE
jgi:hypothetical protein